ncbi:MAG: cytochrome c biogenesis protein CcdA [Thermofilum sp.]
MVDAAQLLTLYLLGVAVSFSPCYLPVIPILVAVTSRYSTRRGALAAFLFSLGASISIIIYGLTAIVSTNIFNVFAETRLSQLPTLAGYLLIGLGLMEFTPIREVFAVLPTFSLRLKRAGLAQSLLAGLVFSLAAAPCSFAPLVAFLMAVGLEGARGGNAIPLILSFSAGIGLTLLLIGVASVMAGRRMVEELTRRGIVKHQAKFSGILLMVLGVLTIVTGENFEIAAVRGAETFIIAAEAVGVFSGILAALGVLRVGIYLNSATPMLLGAGLTLMSIQRLSALLPYLGAAPWAPPTEVLFIASRLVLLCSLISFAALGRGFSEVLLLLPTYPAASPPLVDALVAALWFAEWIKRDRLLAFSTLFFVASAVSGLLYSIPDPVKPVVAALILPLHLSILPAWRKTSAALAVLSMLDES